MLKARFFLGFLLILAMPVVYAKDVSVQQAGYNNALKKMEKAEAEYKNDAQDVADTEKLIDRKRKQLVEEQKKADVSRAKFQEAKEQLEQAQVLLDRAWKD